MQTDVFASNPALRPYWYAVARTVDVAPGPAAVTVLGERLVLWRSEGGALVAAPDRCPHREAPLSLGRVENGCLECCYHGWTFGAGGRCVRVPSSEPSVPVPPKSHLTTVHVTERYGLVWVCLGEPIAGIPDIPEEDDATYRRINSPVDEWRASATRMTDNFVDISHFPFVHTGTFGRAQRTVVPKIDLEALDECFFGYRYEVEVNNPAAATVTSGSSAKVLTRQMTSGFNLPFTVRSTIMYETGLGHVILLLSTPIDDVKSYFTFVIWRNDDFSVSAEDVIQFDRAIGAEDRRMLESIEGVLPLPATGTVSTQSDKPSVEWRRRFAALLGGSAPS
ncbi:MAG TPA: aromatic ring-hydroxylating dioxygenase subunit alpha [Acidimicrobiales bacterium]|jgi:phenylpropionate dioxygenase-like ring-hydroxylating dioxygenase large terminal subunit|nr:aromatic ring-hydroxylating dioxygenase subunit alpha [Acidimicrobiales bacterium]